MKAVLAAFRILILSHGVPHILGGHAGQVDEGCVEADHAHGVADADQEEERVEEELEVHHLPEHGEHPALRILGLHDHHLAPLARHARPPLLRDGLEGEVAVHQTPSGIINNIRVMVILIETFMCYGLSPFKY